MSASRLSTRARVLLAVALLGVAVPLATAARGATVNTDGVETRIIELVNDGRSNVGKPGLIFHRGLRDAARGHSRDMAKAGGLNHDGFKDRLAHAAPDPAESNGAPDDGIFGPRGPAACENVGWYSQTPQGATAEEVAQALYRAWYDSKEHKACMLDEYGDGYTVVGVGVLVDGDRWWATLNLADDDSLPPGAPDFTPPTPSPAPKPPEPTPTPRPADCTLDLFLVSYDRCA